MKSKKKQRLLALILSMVLMLSASISAMAEGEVPAEASGTETTENQAAAQSLGEEAVPETEVTTEENGIAAQAAELTKEPVQEETEQEITEVPAENTETPAETTEPVQEETGEPAETTETDQTIVQSTEAQEDSAVAEETPVEEQPAETTEETVTEEAVVSEAAELKQEFTDENGNVTQTVTAYVPEGAFQATADQISMEVSLLNTDDTNYIKGMMEELLPENHYLDGYVLYQIDFKVNDEITQPAKAVTITMNGNDLAVEDTQKAHVFYYDAADPEVEGDKDQLIEVTQKDQLLKSLEESGESTENIEDYDYSEIAVNEGNADTITVKAWESTIYGCYVEKEAVTELTYEDDSVTVTVSADQAGIIPDGAELSVTPITKTEITDDMSKEEKAQAEEINAQYDFTEEQLQKDSEENATTMEGFLAYDICFLVDGEEIEPSGDVKVVMDFKEAAVPEGVSEDAEVTVKHLKEDESAENGIVVEDMTETASVETTENVAVQKVVLVADSFSAFTIYWGRPEIRVHFVSGADGHDLLDSMSLEEFFEKYGNGETADLAPEKSGYRFVKTMIAEAYNEYEETYNDNVYWALRLQKSGRQYQYNRARTDNASDNEWINIDNQVYFIYKPDTFQITTRDSSSDGITLNLFNYDNSIKTDGEKAGFPFYNGKANHVDGLTGSGNTGGDVKSILGSDGYPISINGNSLDFLFGENAMSANYLFSYNAESYSYEYDSQKNHAYYDEDEKRFYVYNYTLSPADTRDSGYADFEVGNFFPFNDTINPQEGKLNYIQYGREQRTNVDYWFGMSMNMNFYQPENGVLPNGDAMRFEFRGDDDVFVYLDGVLILNLGGIHAAESGTIDFSTGTIEENGQTIYDGIYSRYQQSRLFTSGQLKEMFTEIKVDGQTSHIFADYKNVDMDFFYLERGAGASNCHIKFNMPPIPNETIIVGKQITDANASVYSDVEFSFRLETKGEGDNEFTTVTNKTVKVYDASGNYIRDCPVGEDGIFKLKHGERAYFTEYPATTQYRVTEIGVDSDEYDDVTIAGVSVSQISSGGTSEEIHSFRTEELTVAETPMVIFRNRIAASNKRQLNITKQIADNDNNAEYQIQVYLGDEATGENGSPYTGTYWISGREYTATNGIITLQKNQTASIVNIPSETSFKVIEVNLDGNTYIDPVYTVQNADAIGTSGAATGKLILTENTDVTVQNALKAAPDTPYIEVQKTFSGLDDPLNQVSDFKITLSNFAGFNTELTLKDDNVSVSEDKMTYTWRLDNLPAGSYQLQESREGVEGYTVQITVNGEGITSNQSIVINTQKPVYKIERGERFPKCETSQEIDYMPNIIAGTLTSNSGYFVWTENTLSSSERVAVVDLIKNNAGSNFHNITIDSTVFFSTTEKIEEGINYRGTISIDNSSPDSTLLKFTDPSQWSQVYYGIYSQTKAVNAEIEVVNTYTPDNVIIDIQKYGTEYTTQQLPGAKFSLYQGNRDGSGNVSWQENPIEGYAEFAVTDATSELELPAGIYKLEETVAPSGYLKLATPIYFEVSNQEVTLIKEDGTSYGNGETLPDMWELSKSGDTIVLKIKNATLYELPSAGGPGIFLYMIGGTLLLIAGSLMIYINRRKGVLR